ncbi:helix-turn-helix domain-containing protein [Myceligenerans xiligouense]|uniref:Excisionase family DNA binding protein n=1 Tax=Myceligenerans xiligouense TaxID=253184 RepID=A0A3N4YI91_9MICO|nr:helix-turn-helix domain-containing protein [Myceligenerans xiligouense]RPF19817.1 excisionase family DNA binding protein [Myceligenerans xiligouense]
MAKNANPVKEPVNVVPVLYRVEEAAEALRISRDSIYELIRSGRLRTIKVGARRLVPVVSLTEYVAEALDGAA